MSALDALLARLPRTALFVGKGGVGKTTCAAGIAAFLAARGEKTLLVSTDPAASLSSVLGTPVSTSDRSVRGYRRLAARQLSTEQLRHAFLAEWRDTIAEIVDRGTYLERSEVDGLVDAALPGADEIFALLALADLIAENGGYERLVVDTAPTGHTLRLLALPQTFSALLSMLDAMQEKHRFIVRALAHGYRRDRADEFLGTMRARIDGLRAALTDESAVAAVVVTRLEPVVAAETRRYLTELRALHLRVAAVVENAVPTGKRVASAVKSSVPRFRIPLAAEPPRDLAAILSTLAAASEVRRASGAKKAPSRAVRAPRGSRRIDASGGTAIGELVRTLTIVGGKGGVGKSTVACALGLAAATGAERNRVLLVSTDPAPSLADAFGENDQAWSRRDVEHEMRDVPGLVVRQMDAGAAFARMRDAYQTRIDSIFDALVGHGVDATADRAIVRELLALAPPGIDELFALSLLGDALAEARFDRIIVDPAPTGHLMRLLELPAIALDWSHRLMRLMLQYRELVALGDAAADLIAFAKRTRTLNAMLRDASQCGAIVVSLDEPVVRAETARLVSALAEREIDVTAVVWNRLVGGPSPLPRTAARRQFCAIEVTPPPVGSAAIRRWSASWSDCSARH